LPVSVTLPSDAPPNSWKPLAGAATEALVFTLGRRPETQDRLSSELSEASGRAFPLPFRILLAIHGYGFAGGADPTAGRRLLDGDINALSEDRGLDFDFGEVLSNDPGNVYKFKPRLGADRRSTLFRDGGFAKFRVATLGDVVKQLGDVAKWAPGTPFAGRVFLLDSVPGDGHLLGLPAVKAVLTKSPHDPKLEIETRALPAPAGSAELTFSAMNTAPSPTDLSHYNNWIQIRLEGAVFTNLKLGDFDRFELLSSASEGRPSTFSRAPVCRLFENLFAAGERNEAGPLRITGGHPRAFVSYHLSVPDGRIVEGPEVEVALRAPVATPKPKVPITLLR
jgi:hypothetical protein